MKNKDNYKDSFIKKVWKKPEIKTLSFKETFGGTLEDWGEATFGTIS